MLDEIINKLKRDKVDSFFMIANAICVFLPGNIFWPLNALVAAWMVYIVFVKN
jgi:hypothetical protein